MMLVAAPPAGQGVHMERTRAQAVLEAVLFTMGESVEVGRLADVIEEDVKTTKELLREMEERYEREDRGIEIGRASCRERV